MHTAAAVYYTFLNYRQASLIKLCVAFLLGSAMSIKRNTSEQERPQCGGQTRYIQYHLEKLLPIYFGIVKTIPHTCF